MIRQRVQARTSTKRLGKKTRSLSTRMVPLRGRMEQDKRQPSWRFRPQGQRQPGEIVVLKPAKSARASTPSGKPAARRRTTRFARRASFRQQTDGGDDERPARASPYRSAANLYRRKNRCGQRPRQAPRREHRVRRCVARLRVSLRAQIQAVDCASTVIAPTRLNITSGNGEFHLQVSHPSAPRSRAAQSDGESSSWSTARN